MKWPKQGITSDFEDDQFQKCYLLAGKISWAAYD
jgi:hypothetical protein